MALFSMTDAQLAFGHAALLDHTDFSLEAGERVGLIGRNGAGKSSLLKIVAGAMVLDHGLITRQSGVTSAYVAQELAFDPDQTVAQVVARGVPQAAALLAEYETLVASMAASPDEAALQRLQTLQARLEAADAWRLRTRVETTLAQLGLASGAAIGSLSGGQIRRVALAQALAGAPDILLLDEPTNHLDYDSIRWLEDLLCALRGSTLLITHDRAFLDRVATRIIELDRGQLRAYPGNFAAYQRRKAQQLEAQALENARLDKRLAQEEIWIRQGVEARRVRSAGRVARLERLRAERAARREAPGSVKLGMPHGERSGKRVAELKGVTWGHGDKTVVREVSATILRGDKVGLLGPNGAGKTTLLKLILGELAPDAGTVRQGANLQVAYFDQLRAQLDLNRSLADAISPGSDWIDIDGQRKHVMRYLSDFLFPPERARAPVSSLSGGERNRLLLARLFARPANLLVLDEPTNDLDIDTLELLEDLLQEYRGTVLLVSHDRAFLDNVVTSVLAWEGDGRWREYVGGFSDWQTQSARLSQPARAVWPGVEPKQPEPPRLRARAAIKLSYREQRELEALPAQIETLESEQKRIGAELEDGSIYGRDPQHARRLAERHAAIELELLALLERWEVLEGKRSGPA